MNKAGELAHLEHFKRVFAGFPPGRIAEFESPDFLIHGEGRTLGIEHTEVFHPVPPDGASPQAQESWAEKTVSRASKLWKKAAGFPLLVQVRFHPRAELSAQNVDTVAQEIVSAIGETKIQPGDTLILKRVSRSQITLPTEVSRVYLWRPATASKQGDRWCCSSAGFVPELTEQDIQGKIDKKEKKLEKYRTRCSEVWLLMVADNLRFPNSVELTASALSNRYATRFYRVFFFWDSDLRWRELWISAS